MSSVTCSICWEIVTSTSDASYLVCGHVYHYNCVEKWSKTSRTCPECRCAITNTKRIYLNLVNDPETEQLNLELTKVTKELANAKADNEIQDAIIKQLDSDVKANVAIVLAKDEDILLVQRTIDELKLTMSELHRENGELKLQVEMEKKENASLNIVAESHKAQLAASKRLNCEINISMADLKQDNHELMKQVLELHTVVSDLTGRLDQFRNEFVNANNKLEAQIEGNEIINNELELLRRENLQLNTELSNIKIQIKTNANLNEITTFAYELLEAIKKEYQNFRSSTALIRPRRHNAKFLRKKTRIDANSDDNLKIKLVKSMSTWKCVTVS